MLANLSNMKHVIVIVNLDDLFLI